MKQAQEELKTISLQIAEDGKEWSQCEPILHHVKDKKDAEATAFNLANYTKRTVRMVHLPYEDWMEEPKNLPRLSNLVSRHSGVYFQARFTDES